MSTSRLRFQLYVETLLGCSDLGKWGSYKRHLEEYAFSNDEAQIAKKLLREDAGDLYYKAILSLCKALNSLFRGYHSWPVVNLYYSNFYSMRSHLAARGIGIIKNKGVYCWTATSGELPIKVDGKGIRGDHHATLAAFRRIVKDDVLQTNTVEGSNVYCWLMDQRNRVQYRDRAFMEPEQEYFHPNIFDAQQFASQVEQYIIDPIPIYCFDPDHSILAAPIRRLLDTRNQFRKEGLPNPIESRLQPLASLIEEIDASPQSLLNNILKY